MVNDWPKARPRNFSEHASRGDLNVQSIAKTDTVGMKGTPKSSISFQHTQRIKRPIAYSSFQFNEYSRHDYTVLINP